MDRRIRHSRAFEDAIVTKKLGDTLYRVLVNGRTHPYDVSSNSAIADIQVGNRVRVAINGRLREIVGVISPYPNPALPEWRDPPSGNEDEDILIDIVPGMWTQIGGFWNTTYSSAFQAALLPISSLSGTAVMSYLSGSSARRAMQTLGVCLIPTLGGSIASYTQSLLTPVGGEIVTRTTTETFTVTPSSPLYVTLSHAPETIESVQVLVEGIYEPAYSLVSGNDVYPYKIWTTFFSIGYNYLTAGSTGQYFITTVAAEDPVVELGGPYIWQVTSIQVNSVEDLGATYQNIYPTGARVTLSSTPSIGDEVEVFYTDATLQFSSESFLEAPFVLNHSPLVDSLSYSVTDPQIEFTLLGPNTIYPVYSPDLLEEVSVTYTYSEEVGDLWECDGIRIDETGLTGVTHSQIYVIPVSPPVSMTPDSWWTGQLNENDGYAQYGQDLWTTSRYGHVSYSPREDCYNIVHSSGMYYVPRNGGAVVKTSWLSDGNLETYVHPDNLNPSITSVPKRGGMQHFGVTLVDKWALQGSWGRVCSGTQSVNIAGLGNEETAGVPVADSTFPIRLLKRGESHTWSAIKLLTPFDLVYDNAGIWETYVLGAGITQNPWSINGFNIPETYKNTSWPATKNAKSFIVGASWAESEWSNELRSANNTKANYHLYEIGLHDAGLTISAISNSGNITSQYTIKGDPSYTESDVADFGALANHRVSQSMSNLSNTSFGILNAYAATAEFGAYHVTSDNDKWFFYYYYNSTGVTKLPIRRHSGPPTLAPAGPCYGDRFTTSNDIEPLTTYQEIVVDSDDYIYFCVNVPYWVRTRDSISAEVTEYVYGQYDSGPFSTYGGWYEFTIPGYAGLDLISFVVDTDSDYPTLDGNRIEVYSQAGHSTPSVRYANRLTIALPTTTTIQNYSNLSFTWAHQIPHRTYTTYLDSNPPGYTTYWGPGYGPTFGLLYTGVARFLVEGDTRASYLRESRVFLYKMHHSEGSLSLVWSKDISQVKTILPDHVDPVQTRLPVSRYGPAHAVRTAGRYIFVVRDLLIDAEIVEGDGATVEEQTTVIDVYDNSTSSPSSYVYRIIIFAYTEPVLYSSWGGSASQVTAHVGITEDDKEWIYLTGKRSRDGTHFRYRVLFDTASYTADYSDLSEHLNYQGGQAWAISGVENIYPNGDGNLIWHSIP